MSEKIFKGFVSKKDAYIGGTLKDYGDVVDRRLSDAGLLDRYPLETVITGIELDDDYFSVEGEDFTCGCRTEYLHVTVNPTFPCENGTAFIGYMGHEWHIYPHE